MRLRAQRAMWTWVPSSAVKNGTRGDKHLDVLGCPSSSLFHPQGEAAWAPGRRCRAPQFGDVALPRPVTKQERDPPQRTLDTHVRGHVDWRQESSLSEALTLRCQACPCLEPRASLGKFERVIGPDNCWSEGQIKGPLVAKALGSVLGKVRQPSAAFTLQRAAPCLQGVWGLLLGWGTGRLAAPELGCGHCGARHWLGARRPLAPIHCGLVFSHLVWYSGLRLAAPGGWSPGPALCTCSGHCFQ